MCVILASTQSPKKNKNLHSGNSISVFFGEPYLERKLCDEIRPSNFGSTGHR